MLFPCPERINEVCLKSRVYSVQCTSQKAGLIDNASLRVWCTPILRQPQEIQETKNIESLTLAECQDSRPRIPTKNVSAAHGKLRNFNLACPKQPKPLSGT